MWKKALICYLIIIYRQIIWFWGDLASLVRLEYLTEKTHSSHSAGQVITLLSQFRPDYYFYFLWSKCQNLLPTLGGQIIYFIYKNCQTPSPHPQRNQLVVPKINQDINEPSYEMVGVKITVTIYGQNNRIFGIFFLVILFSSLTTPNGFIVMVLNCTY